MKKKVSFDFDDCLDRVEVQTYCEELIERGIEVWICTARMTRQYGDYGWNDDVWFMCRRLGIPIENTIFTGGSDKSYFLDGKDFIWHLDDMEYNIEDVDENSDCKGVWYRSWSIWKQECEKLLE